MREPAAWETNETRPFLSVGEASVSGLGRDRFIVESPDERRTVTGFGPARQLAHELAARLRR
jgi:hypothetical protein